VAGSGSLHVEEGVDAELVGLEELTSESEGAGELEEASGPGVVWALVVLVLGGAEGQGRLEAMECEDDAGG